MFSKRVKSKPSQRLRQTSPENDTTDGATATGDDSPSTLVTKIKKKSKPKSRLSFGGSDYEEDAEEAFQVKKSKLSKKLTLAKHSADILPNLDQATISPNRGPKYDQAYLNELKASNRRAPAPDPYDADMSMDLSMDAGDVCIQSVDDVDVLMETSIPSESSIKVAKERRERLRATDASGTEDFISLSLTRRTEDQGPHPESRLMREDDELGEGDDEFADYTSAQERIALGKKSRKVEASKRRDAMKEMIADAEEEDEETMEWEQEQLRRGGTTPSDPSPSSSKVRQTYKAASIPPMTAVPTLGPALTRLTQQLAQLTTSHATNTAALNSLAQERGELDDREIEMRGMVGRAEEKRAWFSSFKEWIEGVAGFLDEKYPLLEKLEEQHVSLLRERGDMIKKRRTQDDEDDVSNFLGNLPLPAKAEETDDIGRVVPNPNSAAQKALRRAARVARRQRRQNNEEAEEGYSTDSELSPSDEQVYSSAVEFLATKTKDVLSDVRAPEFRDPGKGRWSAWREQYTDSYVNAYGGLGVVSVWEFWARLECVGWNCIEEPRSLDAFTWYKGLYEYSRPNNTEGSESELGSDGDLVASMITTAILPRMCKLLEGGALDVYSAGDIRRMVDITEEVEASIEPGNTKVHMLFKTMLTLFDNAIAETEALVSKYKSLDQTAMPFNPDSIPARRRFLVRRIKLLQNLSRWRRFTGERYGIGQSITRLVDGTLLPIAEGGWDIGGEELMHKVSKLLPDELSRNIKNRLR
ncbi:nineteen complex-related protein 2-domain-containing protein [Desarmillaria ectypa]|nr:nineteen complex-related protein 2-domain-containing protein [Desarmillaria ectypa]